MNDLLLDFIVFCVLYPALWYNVLMDGFSVDELPDVRTPASLAILRHSCTHVMAQAVQRLWKDAKLGIGPVVEDGFYYDFDLSAAEISTFSPDVFKQIEKEMQRIINESQIFVRRVVDAETGLKELENEPYKLELVKKKSGVENVVELTIYENYRIAREKELENAVSGEKLGLTGDAADKKFVRVWYDLCKGPHLPNTKILKNAFKVMKSSSAYWLGDDKNPMMQRLYATAWATKEELTAYLVRLEEAAKRDHRKLGVAMDLFSFPDEIGSGLAVFHPKGGVLRVVMEEYSRKKHIEAGYSFVNTPHIAKGSLYEISGHLSWYKDGMFPPMHLDEELDEHSNIQKPGQDYYLKPMNCPMHTLIYRSRTRSYRELPLKLFEFGTVYRYEKSGVIHGLTRVRGLTQDDAHIYCTQEQMESELTSLLKFVLGLLKDYGLSDFYLELSTKDPHKYVGSDEIWETATNTLEEVARNSRLELVPDPGGAAFYGPKISVQARDAIGRTWQMSTIQLDFNTPARFGITYQSSEGKLEQPVMIHRALFGSIERFFGVLTEHYAGAFPPWLSPVQVLLVPVADEFNAYLETVAEKLRVKGIRCELDSSDDRFPKKIRNASQSKVPFILIAGEADAGADAISFRYRDGSQENGVPVDAAVQKIKDIVNQRVQV
jgi:threonyl-tRNA synthetase